MHRWSNFSAFAVYKLKLKEIEEEKKTPTTRKQVLLSVISKCKNKWKFNASFLIIAQQKC